LRMSTQAVPYLMFLVAGVVALQPPIGIIWGKDLESD
jgi:hypothetical protein